jgi:hypothetical protein
MLAVFVIVGVIHAVVSLEMIDTELSLTTFASGSCAL